MQKNAVKVRCLKRFVIVTDSFCGQVLYTHQKTKKAKTWQDGTLKVLATGTKVRSGCNID